jgi:hypothetical protein
MIYAELGKDQLIKDAPYSWFLFDQAKLNARYRLVDFKEQANSVEAYLDALVVALNAGETVEEWLDMDDWGSCFILAVLGIRLNQVKLFETALDSLRKKQETHYREIVDACLWDKVEDLSPWLVLLFKHKSPVAQQAAIAVARVNPSTLRTEILQSYIKNEKKSVIIQVLNWLGEH